MGVEVVHDQDHDHLFCSGITGGCASVLTTENTPPFVKSAMSFLVSIGLIFSGLPLKEDFFECRFWLGFVFFIKRTKANAGEIVYKKAGFYADITQSAIR